MHIIDVSGYGSVWLERTAGGREVAGSNPVTPILAPFYGAFSVALIKRMQSTLIIQ